MTFKYAAFVFCFGALVIATMRPFASDYENAVVALLCSLQSIMAFIAYSAFETHKKFTIELIRNDTTSVDDFLR